MSDRYRIARLEDMSAPIPAEANSYEWKPIRQHLGIRAFGINGLIARRAGDFVVEDHTEVQEGCRRHEELYLVTAGRARFTIEGDEVDAPAGTFVFVPDPEARRSARAIEDGTTVVAIGAQVGVAYDVSPWERKYFE
jgi:mannose-6-phosphate isomerase-like protein (cupin superfamily)